MSEFSVAEMAAYQEGMTDQQKMLFLSQYNGEKKDRTIALVLSIVAGPLGVDRFYVGDIGMGILKLLTGGLCGVLFIIDWFLIMGCADDYNRAKAYEIAMTIRGT